MDSQAKTTEDPELRFTCPFYWYTASFVFAGLLAVAVSGSVPAAEASMRASAGTPQESAAQFADVARLVALRAGRTIAKLLQV